LIGGPVTVGDVGGRQHVPPLPDGLSRIYPRDLGVRAIEGNSKGWAVHSRDEVEQIAGTRAEARGCLPARHVLDADPETERSGLLAEAAEALDVEVEDVLSLPRFSVPSARVYHDVPYPKRGAVAHVPDECLDVCPAPVSIGVGYICAKVGVCLRHGERQLCQRLPQFDNPDRWIGGRVDLFEVLCRKLEAIPAT
jgi:hypothetical protein